MKNGKHEKEMKISQYADDGTLLLFDEHQLNAAINEIRYFIEVAGPKLNVNKTIGMFLGRNIKNEDGIIEGILFTNKPIKCLGIYVGRNIEECERLNWENKAEQIKQRLIKWENK